jgi:flagellar biosynthesis/type III secretory pathway M-ring protein FliF/YscJ
MTLLAAPALPLHTAGKYVAGAYIVFVVMLVVYLGIMALRTSRTRRELGELKQELAERQGPEEHVGAPVASGPARRGDHLAEPEREVAR